MSKTTIAISSSRTGAASQTHLRFLDGLRGLAALFVVAHHAFAPVYLSLPPVMRACTQGLTYAEVAVDIFIVLSGYCLMLPVASSEDGQLRGGTWQFYKRRARRILPPYYAALAMSLLLIKFVPGMGHPTGIFWDTALPAFTPVALISHLFLVYNFIPGMGMKIDYPMWTVAIEWSIYFLFPLLLLPVWCRFGVGGLLATAVAVIGAIHVLQHRFHLIFVAAPWFLVLFSLGMTGAVINFRSERLAASLRERLPWGWIAGVLWLAYWLIALTRVSFLAHHIWETDVYVGVAAASLIVFCARWADNPGVHPAILRLFESRWAVSLGVFSYSLYLVHAPLLVLLHLALRPLAIAPVPLLAIHEIVGVPMCVLFAYGFSRVFEIPFLRSLRRSGPTDEAREAALSPAP